MNQKEQKKIKTTLTKLVKEKGNYQKETDDQLIESYIFNLIMLEQARVDIATRGVVVQIGKDLSFTQKNFSVNTYHDCQRMINEIAKKLGIEKEPVVVDQKANAKSLLNQLLN